MKINKLKKKYLKHKRIKDKELFPEGQVRLSGIGGCLRAQVYSALGYPRKEPGLKTLSIFEAGHLCENFVHKIYKKEYGKENIEKQVEIETPYKNLDGTPIIGHADFWIKAEEENILVEVKSIREGAKHFGLPKKEHKLQLIAYLHFFLKTYKGKLIYVVKDTFELIPFSIDNTGFRLSNGIIDKRMNKLKECLEERKLPKREHSSQNKYPCYWKTKDGSSGGCDFRKICWKLK